MTRATTTSAACRSSKAAASRCSSAARTARCAWPTWRRWRHLSTVGLLLAGAATPALAADPAPEPIGIALEGYPYPYPVQFLPLVVNGQPVRMAYMDITPAAGPAAGIVLLLHGHNFPSSYWSGVIRALMASDRRVIVPDQIGFNKSSKPDGPWSFDTAAANTVALLDHLLVGEVDVIGHSQGGMLAARLARNFPERVRRLVLEAPLGLEDYRLTVPPVADATLARQAMALTADGYYEQLQSSYHAILSREQLWTFIDLRQRLAGSAEFPRWVRSDIASTQAIWTQPVVHELPLIAQPTLFVVGERDRTAPGRAFARPDAQAGMGHVADLARALAPTMPDARVVALDTGHLVHLETPAAFDDAVLGFLRD